MKKIMTSLIVALACTAIVTPAVSGDTIHLKNGLKFKAYIIDQTAEKVTFSRYGGKISIAMDQVEKIDRDNFGKIDEEQAEQMAGESSRQRVREDARAEQAGRTAVPGMGAPPPDRVDRSGAGDDEQVEDETAKKTYWQNLKKDLERQIESKKAQLLRLEKERRGLARNYTNTSEIRKEIDDLRIEVEQLEKEYQDLPNKARKEGVPPGWLR